MKKFLLYAGIALLTASPSQAQGQGPRKWSGEFDALVAGQTVQRIAGRQVQTVSPDQMVDAHVSVSDAEAVAQYITDNGFEAEVITPRLITVTIPASFIKPLAERSDVRFVNAPQQCYANMVDVRPETGVDKVTAGEGLETPFTGKGVVVAVIDQGFEYANRRKI